MDKKYEKSYHETEEEHWWFRSRREIVLNIVRKFVSFGDAKILDIGCASGLLLSQLHSVGYKNLYGIDKSWEAISLCQKRGHATVSIMNAEVMKFDDNEFDCVVASDVLEHIENDLVALREWLRILKPKGVLVVFVPAYSFLWSSHDTLNQHYRRYTRSDLKKIMVKAGFDVIRTSYWNFVLLVPIAFLRTIRHIFKPLSDDGYLRVPSPSINHLLSFLLYTENYLLRFMDLPFGVSVFAVCLKK